VSGVASQLGGRRVAILQRDDVNGFNGLAELSFAEKKAEIKRWETANEIYRLSYFLRDI